MLITTYLTQLSVVRTDYVSLMNVLLDSYSEHFLRFVGRDATGRCHEVMGKKTGRECHSQHRQHACSRLS